MLRLESPYGWPNGIEVTMLQTTGTTLNKRGVVFALLECSCYPPAIPKIVRCLEQSKRYDCRVMDGVARNGSIPEILKEVGITYIVYDMPKGKKHYSREMSNTGREYAETMIYRVMQDVE